MPDPGLAIGATLGAAAGQGGRERLTPEQGRVIEELSAWRSARPGGRVARCCGGVREYLYNSCRNRHRPKCRAGCRAGWLGREAGCLLPVGCHHLAFTPPAEVAELAVHNPRLVDGLLFEAASEPVRQVAANRKQLGARVGVVAVLHTWGQTLSLHPHLRILATGGGLSWNARGEIDDDPTCKSGRPGFFLPVRRLGVLCRGKFLAAWSEAREQGHRLRVGAGAALAWSAWLAAPRTRDWVASSRPPGAGAPAVSECLARYACRAATSNNRLLAVSDGEVTFSYKGYRQNGHRRQMTRSVAELARRFLQPAVPRGFVRVRHGGLLANRGRDEKLRVCRRRLLAEAARPAATAANDELAVAGRRRAGPKWG